MINVVNGRDLTASHVAAWEELRISNPNLRSPYFSPSFTRLVAAVRTDVRVAIIGGSSDPTAFFPFQVGPWRRGRPVGGALSDYHGLIASQDYALAIPELIADSGLAEWGFDHVPADQEAFAPYATSRSYSPYMDLELGYAAYCEQVRANGSKQVNKVGTLQRKLEREQGSLRFVMDSTDGHLLARLMALKSEQYRESGIADAFAHDWIPKLLAAIHATREDDFAGILSALYLGEEPIALHFGMRSKDVLHYWFPAYLPDYAKFSPGLILLLQMAEAAPACGIRQIDLGKGSTLYKQRLMSGKTELLEGSINTPSLLKHCRSAFSAFEQCMSKMPAKGLRTLPARLRGRMGRRRRFK
jgi:CelD/BcsL family acetyltransferase involved in cellulose biosynthesis